jgi:hypothetical protein
MGDVIDSISEGKIVRCPYSTCSETRSDMNPDVAIALINNHVRRDHPNEEE